MEQKGHATALDTEVYTNRIYGPVRLRASMNGTQSTTDKARLKLRSALAWVISTGLILVKAKGPLGFVTW